MIGVKMKRFIKCLSFVFLTFFIMLGGCMDECKNSTVTTPCARQCAGCPKARMCTDTEIKHPEAAICGLYCATCPSFGKDCDGCLSSRVAEECRGCPNGFRECAAQKGVTRCYECPDFPCERLKKFTQTHIVNGVKHHEYVIQNLEQMRDSGVENWVNRMDQETRCPQCNHRIIWYEKACSACKTSIKK